jgi:hypothetical protein
LADSPPPPPPPIDQALVATHGEFLRNFTVLSTGLMKFVDMSNVIVVGASVLASLMPGPHQVPIHVHYRSAMYKSVDVQLYLYNLSLEQVCTSLLLDHPCLARLTV